jgi:hypothetical protein
MTLGGMAGVATTSAILTYAGKEIPCYPGGGLPFHIAIFTINNRSLLTP